MLGWELRELRLRVTKIINSKSSQMRSKDDLEKKPSEKKHVTQIAQILPGEGLSEGLRGLMENSGNSARDSGELRGELRNSGNSDHTFWRTQEELRGHPPRRIPRGAGRQDTQDTRQVWGQDKHRTVLVTS